MDQNTLNFLITALGVGIAAVGFVYGFLRNFRDDINAHIDAIEKRQNILDDRMFFLATGQRLEDVIKRERMKELP